MLEDDAKVEKLGCQATTNSTKPGHSRRCSDAGTLLTFSMLDCFSSQIENFPTSHTNFVAGTSLGLWILTSDMT